MIEQHVKDLLPADLPVYLGDLPSGVINAIGIVLFNGAYNSEYFAFGTVFKPVVKIVIRNQSYATARQWAETIKATLHRHTDDFFISILMRGYPMYLGKDEQKLHNFQVTFNIEVKE